MNHKETHVEESNTSTEDENDRAAKVKCSVTVCGGSSHGSEPRKRRELSGTQGGPSPCDSAVNVAGASQPLQNPERLRENGHRDTDLFVLPSLSTYFRPCELLPLMK